MNVDEPSKELARAMRSYRLTLVLLLVAVCLSAGAVVWALHNQGGRYAISEDCIIDTRTGQRWLCEDDLGRSTIIDLGTIDNPTWKEREVRHPRTRRPARLVPLPSTTEPARQPGAPVVE